MRKPPRKKAEPIITWRIRARVIFSASIIVIGTLFVYYFALSDDQMISRRDQTMVRIFFTILELSLCLSLLTESKKKIRPFPASSSSTSSRPSKTAGLAVV
jgi:magnesium-transporting ATPase (P-type)